MKNLTLLHELITNISGQPYDFETLDKLEHGHLDSDTQEWLFRSGVELLRSCPVSLLLQGQQKAKQC